MPFTASSDLFGSVNEDGFNRIIRHVMRKRPSLFNYGTQWVADDWETRLCVRPEVDDLVLAPSNEPGVVVVPNPVLTVEPPLPVLGTGGAYGLNFAAQVVDLSIDFHPSEKELPPQLGGKLVQQRFALFAQICAGIGCPDERALEGFPPVEQSPIVFPGQEKPRVAVPPPPSDRDTIPLPTESLDCFCLDLFVVGYFEMKGAPGVEVVEMKVEGVELIDVQPDNLESNVECYVRTLLHYVVLPRLRVALSVYVFKLFDGIATATLKAETGVANNPAVEDDQLKVFVDLEMS